MDTIIMGDASLLSSHASVRIVGSSPSEDSGPKAAGAFCFPILCRAPAPCVHLAANSRHSIGLKRGAKISKGLLAWSSRDLFQA